MYVSLFGISGALHLDIFEQPAKQVFFSNLLEGIEVRILSIKDIIRNKKASGRTKDLADAEALESAKYSE